jgi:hypothetical protein
MSALTFVVGVVGVAVEDTNDLLDAVAGFFAGEHSLVPRFRRPETVQGDEFKVEDERHGLERLDVGEGSFP